MQEKMQNKADVVVIGGGVIGCAIAYYLAKSKVDTVLVEKNSMVASEAGGRNGGGVRQQGRGLADLPIAMASIRLWANLDKELDCDTEYQRKGNIWIACTELEKELQFQMAEMEKKAGLHVNILGKSEIKRIIPQLCLDHVLQASYCPTDGHANPIYTTLGFAWAAQKKGARIYTKTKVVALERQNGEIYSVVTNHGEIKTNIAVNSAGAWGAIIGKMVELDIPIYPFRDRIIVTEKCDPLFGQFVMAEGWWVRQDCSGTIHIGMGRDPHSSSDFYAYDKKMHSDDFTKLTEVAKFMSSLNNVNIIHSWSGTNTTTPDDLPIIGYVDTPEGFVMACGFSHGFCLAPAIGKLMTELIIKGKASVPLDHLRLGRFNRGSIISGPHYA